MKFVEDFEMENLQKIKIQFVEREGEYENLSTKRILRIRSVILSLQFALPLLVRFVMPFIDEKA